MGNRFDTQDKLIAATRQIIIDEGIEATSLEHICKVAGFSRGAFYSNFSSKDSLLAALAEDEYIALIERLRTTVEEWATRPVLDQGDGPLIENLLFEALDAICVDKALYVLHSELLLRSIRDPEWGARLLDINVQFADELGRVLEWILEASGRHLTKPLRAMTHSVIGIVMRAAGVAAWRETTMRPHHTSTAAYPHDAHRIEGAADSPQRTSVRNSAASELLEVILLILYASSEPRGERVTGQGKPSVVSPGQ